MLFFVTPILLAGHLVVTVADQIPRFAIDAVCQTEASAATGLSLAQDAAACKHDEQDAYDRLVKQWAQYRPIDRKSCANLATEGSANSYVELLTCLEMANQVKGPPPGADK